MSDHIRLDESHKKKILDLVNRMGTQKALIENFKKSEYNEDVKLTGKKLSEALSGKAGIHPI